MKGKKKKGKWDRESFRKSSMRYNIPKSTQHNKMLALIQPKIDRFINTFSPEYEQTSKDDVKYLYNRCLTLMEKKFLKLAFDLTEAMKIPHRFNKQKQAGGKYFHYDSMQRHTKLSLRAPALMSIMRALKFNKPQANIFKTI